jgi:uncharacterized protein YjbI with pentapeptide repeats
MTILHRSLVAAIALAVSAAGALSLAPAAEAVTCTPAPYANCAGADLAGVNLAGLQLESIDLKGANLRGAILTGAKLRNAWVDGADLTGADLSGAYLYAASFRRATLNRAKLVGAIGTHVDLSNVQLQHADLSGAQFGHARLEGSQLDHANLTNTHLMHVEATATNFAMATLTGAELTHGRLRGANFFGAQVHRTSFAGADLIDASFHGADFHQTDFGNALVVRTTVLPSNIASDPKARAQLFEKVYAHVNAYGSSDQHCSDDGSGPMDHVECTGFNDDPKASLELSSGVEFGWGGYTSGKDTRRSFWIVGRKPTWPVTLRGQADLGLGSFWVHSAGGTINRGTPSHTANHAGRGEIGGPLAIYIGFHHGIRPGYHMNVSGYVQRTDYARIT